MGICQTTFFRWKKVYGGLMPSEVRKLKQLEHAHFAWPRFKTTPFGFYLRSWGWRFELGGASIGSLRRI